MILNCFAASKRFHTRKPTCAQLFLVLVAAAVFVATSDASARPKADWGAKYEQALKHYQNGKPGEAYKEFLALADVGSAPAQTMIGHMYLKGEGVAQSNGTAAMWFYRAANRGYVPAQLAFGHVRETGTGLGRNLIAAAAWYMIVEKRGNPKFSNIATTFLERVSKQLTPEMLVTAQSQANAWRPAAELTP